VGTWRSWQDASASTFALNYFRAVKGELKMFHDYSENAKQTIFFAKGEAAQLGSLEISPAHILLALMRDEELTSRLMTGFFIPAVREDILVHVTRRESLPSPVDLPLSVQSEQALSFARDEAQTHSQHVSNSHILLGLLRVEDSTAAQLLRLWGLSVENVRSSIEALGGNEQDVGTTNAGKRPGPAEPPEAALAQFLARATREVNGLARRGEKRDALKLLDDLMAQPSAEQARRIRCLTPLAVGIALSIGDTGLARRYCETNLANNPDHPMALYAIADCLAREGDTKGAESYAARCYELSAARKDAVGNGTIELLQKRFPEISLGS
jgi:tetratricopeptide (TPR) repeat protein